ncbi:hypothetical protein GGR51DRAFT_545666 [Nemania sp. FL0031]|nr:hypothetical protein GGR51DRAFT_545666 [Nemania sp. FL0031]
MILQKRVKGFYREGVPLSNEKFLPYDKLDELMTEETINSAFEDVGIEESKRASLAKWVCENGRRLFLILVLSSWETKELLSHLEKLKNDGVDDNVLPLEFGDNYGYQPGPRKEEESDKKFFSFKRWKDNDKELFKTHQWPLSAPVFGLEFRHQLHLQQPLPYLNITPEPVSSGFFGEVSRAEIHQAHVHTQLLEKLGLEPRSASDHIPIAIKKAKDNEDLRKFFDQQTNFDPADKEERNLKALQEISSPHLIQPIAAYQKGSDRCLIFPWAEGGNLSNYWKSHENDREDRGRVKWLIDQFAGLFSALEILHKENCRHGDLKPENILWFKDDEGRGTLKIADMGLAAFHEKEANTGNRFDRGQITETPFGTDRFGPPEMDKTGGQKASRSRQYDIWSMGCIIVELLVWLMYGFEGLEIFRRATKNNFWDYKFDPPSPKVYCVNKYVDDCLDAMKEQLEDNTAYMALLELARDRLLVVNVSREYVSSPNHREIAEKLHSSMKNICRSCEDRIGYLALVRLEYPAIPSGQELLAVPETSSRRLSSTPDPQIPPVSESDESKTADQDDTIPQVVFHAATDDRRMGARSSQERSPGGQEQSKQLNDTWDSIPDNQFAAHFFKLIDWDQIKPKDAALCSQCKTICSSQLFLSKCDLFELQLSSRTCHLCRLLLDSLYQHDERPPQVVSLHQNGAVIGIEGGPKLLSIYVNPKTGPDIPKGLQLGLPRLPDQGSREQFTLLKEWLKVCDETHENCRSESGNALTMPTRVVELGTTLRIVESTSIEPSKYVALSHCWGNPKGTNHFCATTENIDILKKSIDFNRLPKTFRDAIMVVKGIGVKYLWIDSLCIIQDKQDDWEHELTTMEQVFSSAYCTLAASSARSSVEGFLDYRKPRPCVEIETSDETTLYACPHIDDFHGDVDLGTLNTRGWVLQERALSRRTIFYTSNQVYWECGVGVHCETLARLQNSKAALLGDPRFPRSTLAYYRDGRQMLVQDLYERYSGLAFSKEWDRPMAILGLETRLARAFNTQAAHGFFALYFARLLLWKRRNSRWMTRIKQRPGSSHVPTWSWLSKVGAIKYLDLKFQETHWEVSDFKNPFERPTSPSGATNTGKTIDAFQGLARRLTMRQLDMLVSVIFDEKQDFNMDELRCVFIGRDKIENELKDIKHHVLVIHRIGVPGKAIYERVGVASLKPEHVAGEGSWVEIR